MVTLRVSMPAYLFNGREPTMNHDKMMNAIHEIFDPALPRLAPGDDAVTRRALDLLFNGGLGACPATSACWTWAAATAPRPCAWRGNWVAG